MNRPSAIVLLTGSELTRGETRDSNGSFLASELTRLGVRVLELRLVPDDMEALERTVRWACSSADIVLASGGLGPTADDLSVAAMANVFGRGVVRDEPARLRMRKFATDRLGDERLIPPNFDKQSEVVEGSTVLGNPVGLAPGFVVETDIVRDDSSAGVLIAMPGVPRELIAMFQQGVVPLLRERFSLLDSLLLETRWYRAKILGVPESGAEDRIEKLGFDDSKLEYGISAKPGDLTVRFIARGPDDAAELDSVRVRMAEEFGKDLVELPETLSEPGSDISWPRVMHERLLAAGVTLATAESCTGGMIAAALTQFAGSSAYFLGSAVTYANAAKVDVLGVGSETLDSHGAVSDEVAREMAAGARERFGADYAVSVTGIAGPGGGSPEKPVGQVHIGIAGPDGVTARGFRFSGSRATIRERTVTAALDSVRRAMDAHR
ncbi:MAG: CinA family nicotinamide mononucleotide deamidase-related protein [Planctomycetota bacterium]